MQHLVRELWKSKQYSCTQVFLVALITENPMHKGENREPQWYFKVQESRSMDTANTETPV